MLMQKKITCFKIALISSDLVELALYIFFLETRTNCPEERSNGHIRKKRDKLTDCKLRRTNKYTRNTLKKIEHNK